MDEPRIEVVQSVGGYAMAEDGNEFIVYATARPEEILGRFPGDDSGFTQAEELYRSLLAPYRRRRYVTAFLVLFFAALVIHVLSLGIFYVISFGLGEPQSSLINLVQRWANVAAAISNTIWITALAAMAGLWLVPKVFPKSPATP
jgi:hypothetical protein